MNEKTPHQPSRSTKLLAWLILGSFSTFFAEVVSGSDMFPFFHPWGILVVIPLYTLHLLVLSYIVFTYSKPRFYTLFIAGALFGMYEAYITKVLFDPTWGDPILLVGGIAVIETIVLVLFWHPFWAFIIPLFAGERILSISRVTVDGLPIRIRKIFDSSRSYMLLVLMAFMAGAIQSGNSPDPGISLLSGISTTGFLLILIDMWRRKTHGNEYELIQLLPSKGEFRFLFSLLMIFYVLTGLAIRPEIIPEISYQKNIWLIYGVLFILLYLNIKRSHKVPSTNSVAVSDSTGLSTVSLYKKWIGLALIFTFTSSLFCGAGTGQIFMLVIAWFGGGILGMVLLILSTRDLLFAPGSKAQ